MDFKPDFSKLSLYITKEDILAKISTEDIYKRFCSSFPVDLTHSPFPGRRDENPSFGFFYLDGKWLWKDYGIDESGDVFQFVQKMERTDFHGALVKIQEAFNINPLGAPVERIVRANNTGLAKDEDSRIIIETVKRPLNSFDYKLWASWGVSSFAMKYLDIQAAEEVWYRKPDMPDFVIWARYLDTNPVYWWSHPYTPHIKAYKPLEKNKRKKWINNCNNYTDVQGYAQCHIKKYPGRPLILTSSMKEVGFFRSFRINAMAGHTEGSKFSPDFIRHLFKYCHPIISAYDADGAGVKAAMYLRKEYGIPLMPICNSRFKSKDPTDLYKENYKASFEYIHRLNNLIEEYADSQRSPGSTNLTGSVLTA